jgi:hypothetical protein
MYQSLAVVATACSQYGARAFSISCIDMEHAFILCTAMQCRHDGFSQASLDLRQPYPM